MSHRRLSNWDQTGQRWQSEHDDKGQVTPKPIDHKSPKIQPVKVEIAESKADINFKRQPDHDTFGRSGSMSPATARKRTALMPAIGLFLLAGGAALARRKPKF